MGGLHEDLIASNVATFLPVVNDLLGFVLLLFRILSIP